MTEECTQQRIEELPEWAQEIIAHQQVKMKQLTQQVGMLLLRVQELEDQLAKNSQNSSKPPSSDGLKKPSPKPSQAREKGKRKSGGQKGHQGHTLEMSANPDEVVRYQVSSCPQCQADLSWVEVEGVGKRQVYELPPARLVVTEHQAERKICPCCGERVEAIFPTEVTHSTQYGVRFKGLLSYLSGYQLLPLKRICEVVEDVYGQSVSQGTVVRILRQLSQAVQPSLSAIEGGLLQAQIAHADETSLRVAGKNHWLHVLSTPMLTAYAVHPKRGKQALNEIGLIPNFKGDLVHDAYRSYFAFSQCGHVLCNAHLLRELTFLHEQHQQEWAGEMKDLLLDIKRNRAQTEATGLSDCQQQTFVDRYQSLVETGLALHPPPITQSNKRRVRQSTARNLLLRLQNHRHAILAFMRDPAIPFDNNQAERDIRMMKVKQKIAGCFRTPDGATLFARIRSYLSTVRKQRYPLLQALVDAFSGTPFIPVLTYPE